MLSAAAATLLQIHVLHGSKTQFKMQLNLDLLQWKCVQFASKQIIYVIVIISGKETLPN